MATTPTPPVPVAPGTLAPAPVEAARPTVPSVLRRRLPGSRRALGQSLAEFALTVPMALFMVLFGLDFGRVFLGWVSLNQAAREAANYAAMNPTAWTAPYNYAAQSEYARLITTEAAEINCDMGSVPSPVFSSGTSIAAPATVTLTCDFSLITPIISIILGDSIAVSASSAFPIRAGTIEGVPLESATPTSTPAPSATASPSSSVGPTGSPGASATIAPTDTPTPTSTAAPLASGYCSVPSLIGTKTNRATFKWQQAGFSGSVIFSPLVPPTYTIAWQSLTVGTAQPCTSGITVRSNAP